MAGALDRRFAVANGVGVAEQIIGKVVPGIEAIEDKLALSHLKPILDLLVEHPAAADLELVPSPGPGNIIPKLVVVG